MTEARLVACASCARHVRVSEAACPFCAAGLDADARTQGARRGPTERLSRAALIAFGAGTLAVAACGGVVAQGGSAGQKDSGGTTSHDDAALEPDVMGGTIYGGFPAPDASFGFDAGNPEADASDAAPEAQWGVPYGLPPEMDAGTPDASVPGLPDGSFVPPYGKAPDVPDAH
jgi:hypothetical protein